MNVRFSITRPVEAVIMDSAELALLAPEAPYCPPPPRPEEQQLCVNVGEMPQNLGKKVMGKLPTFRMPQQVRNLREVGSLVRRTADAQALLPSTFEASTYGDWWHILLFMEELQSRWETPLQLFDALT